jgi:NADP-dependent 3-hydroxy acid dehydrogenase YdfG
MNMKGKVVIVTGASSGIGEAAAREFGRAGARVVIAARRLERLQALAHEIEALGADVLVVQTDMSKFGDIQSLVSQTIERFGRVDVLVNNAGFGRLDWLEQLDPMDDIQAQMDVNVMGVIHTTRQVLPVMINNAAEALSMCAPSRVWWVRRPIAFTPHPNMRCMDSPKPCGVK